MRIFAAKKKTDTPTGSPVASSPISSGSFTRNSPGSSYAYPPTMSPVSSKSEPSSPSSPGGYFNGSLQPFDIYSEYNDKVWKEGFLIKEGRLVKSWKKRYFQIKGSVLTYFKSAKKNESDVKGRMDLKGAQVYYLGDVSSYDSFFQTMRFNTVLENEEIDSDDEEEAPNANNSSFNSSNANNTTGNNAVAIQRKLESNAYKYKFCVIAADRELFMAAASIQDAKDWVKRIRACIFVEDYFVDCKSCGVERPLLSVVMLLTSVASMDATEEEKKSAQLMGAVDDSRHSDIETLVLQHEDPFTISDLKALTTTCIQSTRVNLKSLSITHCGIGDEHLRLLAHGMADNQTITTLDLSHNFISDFGICDLIDGLFLNVTLKRLSFSHNSIGDVGCVYLSDLLLGNVSIKKLDISYNRIGANGAKSLSKALISNTLLRVLDLGHNNIGNEGCSSLAEGLKQNKTLETLDLSFNSIGSDGLTRLCNEGIIYNRGLKDLSLHGNAFDNAGAKSLVKALIDHKTLKRVDCGENSQIGTEGIITLAQTLTTKYMVGKLVMRSKNVNK
ncbi:hypothetical protein FDP41_012601 [Naegleria fowleri]|uniref:PH domain-containing protein n=1 Tax=Naegleria fowleri TaxID=5763 RepID=A0A6A5C2S3_NAEFO|nr:uncharacterized protein FDP41_012601 [Naegleria fowleri]KAF0981341.1 hypothetical protein FDP41_012601 [Naegleria fowleri]CAG4709751.1 unnamed protein product [Naegleria fowleri]